MNRAKCIICGKTLPEEGQQICTDCLAEKSDAETAEELRDIAGVLSITAGTDANIKKSMEAIMRIAYRIDRRNEGSGGKRRNRHCQSKQEVLQRVRQQRAAEQQEKRKPPLKRQLQTINRIKPSVDRARAQMREKNRRESKSDIV